MIRWLAVIIAVLVWMFASSPAYALYCRVIDHQTVCILDIKRSAKNYWEYRAALRVGDDERPIEQYNCRDRLRIKQDGTVIPFAKDRAGEIICNLFNR